MLSLAHGPKRPFRTKPKWLPSGEAVTVCIAAVHEESARSSIFLICDRRISLFSGWFSQDGNAKYTQVHRDWFGMFAGGVEETNLMLREVNKSLDQLHSVPFERVVDRSRSAYAKVRKRLIETQILPEFEILTYKAFKTLQRSDEALYLTIKEKVIKAEENWNLLFAGFDNNREPHIFVISGPGNVEYCDKQRYGAIGTGAFAALVWLSFCGYHSRKHKGTQLFNVMAAKFFAEKASDVGQTSVVSLVNSDMNAIFHFDDVEVSKVRAAWESLPRESNDAAKELANRMTERDAMVKQFLLSDHPKPANEYHLKTGQREQRLGH